MYVLFIIMQILKLLATKSLNKHVIKQTIELNY
jgi:hypothetical protein